MTINLACHDMIDLHDDEYNYYYYLEFSNRQRFLDSINPTFTFEVDVDWDRYRETVEVCGCGCDELYHV